MTWMDDCGDYAICMLAYHTLGYCYANDETKPFDIYLLSCDDGQGKGILKYEWIQFDTQFTLYEFVEV